MYLFWDTSLYGYLTMMGGYKVKAHWSLKKAYNYFVECSQNLLTKWALWNKEKDARKWVDVLVFLFFIDVTSLLGFQAQGQTKRCLLSFRLYLRQGLNGQNQT
uniref:Uncharacterized protein n=1 Tax=Romanomermis culicivorax TaxID=13658 RepID=A0A915HQ40_ROMCU